MQLEIGMSTSRYLPASGTAGLARSLVSGNRRVPCPPPMMTERTLLVLMVWRPVCDIGVGACCPGWQLISMSVDTLQERSGPANV